MAQMQFRNQANLTPGTYRFIVDDVADFDKGKFGPSVQWRCKVNDADSEENGNSVNYLTALKFGPTSRTYKFLKALGMNELNDDIDFDNKEFIGAEFYGQVEAKTVDSKEYSNITNFWSVDEFEKMIAKVSKKSVLVKEEEKAPPTVSDKGKVVGSTVKTSKKGAAPASETQSNSGDEDGDLNFPVRRK
jgi:hypothetical protein